MPGVELIDDDVRELSVEEVACDLEHEHDVGALVAASFEFEKAARSSDKERAALLASDSSELTDLIEERGGTRAAETVVRLGTYVEGTP